MAKPLNLTHTIAQTNSFLDEERERRELLREIIAKYREGKGEHQVQKLWEYVHDLYLQQRDAAAQLQKELEILRSKDIKQVRQEIEAVFPDAENHQQIRQAVDTILKGSERILEQHFIGHLMAELAQRATTVNDIRDDLERNHKASHLNEEILQRHWSMLRTVSSKYHQQDMVVLRDILGNGIASLNMLGQYQEEFRQRMHEEMSDAQKNRIELVSNLSTLISLLCISLYVGVLYFGDSSILQQTSLDELLATTGIGMGVVAYLSSYTRSRMPVPKDVNGELQSIFQRFRELQTRYQVGL